MLPTAMRRLLLIEDDDVCTLVAPTIMSPSRSSRRNCWRVKALLRRTGTPGADEALHAGDLIVDPASFSVTRGGKNVTLSTLEFRLLYFLVAHPNQVFSRDQLLDRVWGIDRHVIPRSVDVYIRHLRKKVLLPSGGGVALKTLRDAGYLLEVKKRV